MKIVIVGDGKMGFTLTRHLSEEGHDVTVIDHNAEILERTGDILDVACLRGDGISLAVLMSATFSSPLRRETRLTLFAVCWRASSAHAIPSRACATRNMPKAYFSSGKNWD